MEKYAVIVAGGSGLRAGGPLPKQFQELAGRPMLWWAMDAFRREDPATRVILVVNGDYISLWNGLYGSLPEEDKIPCRVCRGGASRPESVARGLQLIGQEASLVAVHDAARPLVSTELIARGWEAAMRSGAAVPVVAVSDSLRMLSDGGSAPVDRSRYVAVQTPQVFRSSVLLDAYSRVSDYSGFTDDASLVEAAGHKVALYDGDPVNMKITHPGDAALAAARLTDSRL